MAPHELIQSKFTTLSPIDDELALSLRTKFLVGREVEGILENRGSGFFVKWNEELIDDIWVTKQCIAQLGISEAELAGARVKCTIEKMGPHHAHWLNQHPMTKTVTLIPMGLFSNMFVARKSSGSSNGSFKSRVMKDRCQKAQRPRFVNSKRSVAPLPQQSRFTKYFL